MSQPLPELLDALRAGDGVNLIRDAVRLVMQELIELEATEAIGAARYERSDARTNERNGHRPRLLSTQASSLLGSADGSVAVIGEPGSGAAEAGVVTERMPAGVLVVMAAEFCLEASKCPRPADRVQQQ